MSYTLGIDMGTTYTAAAVARDGRAEVVALGYRATSVPTVVCLAEDGRFLVGDAAERRAATSPGRVAREFKRRVGDPTPLLLGGSPIAVDRCIAEVLRWVVAGVAETEGRRPDAVTVTHPANWGEFKRDVLRQALRWVDLPGTALLAEPVAAATGTPRPSGWRRDRPSPSTTWAGAPSTPPCCGAGPTGGSRAWAGPRASSGWVASTSTRPSSATWSAVPGRRWPGCCRSAPTTTTWRTIRRWWRRPPTCAGPASRPRRACRSRPR